MRPFLAPLRVGYPSLPVPSKKLARYVSDFSVRIDTPRIFDLNRYIRRKRPSLCNTVEYFCKFREIFRTAQKWVLPGSNTQILPVSSGQSSLFGFQRRMCRSETRDWHTIRRARHVIEPRQLTKVNRSRVAAMLTADSELDSRT